MQVSVLQPAPLKTYSKVEPSPILKEIADQSFDWGVADDDLMSALQLRQSRKNNPESFGYLSETVKELKLEGRAFLLKQAWHRPKHMDDGIKLLMILAFSRALHANNVHWTLAQYAVRQLEQILNFPRLTPLLGSVDNWGKRLFQVFSSGSGDDKIQIPDAKPKALVDSTSSAKVCKVEFLEDSGANIQILHTIPAKPAGYYSGFNREA